MAETPDNPLPFSYTNAGNPNFQDAEFQAIQSVLKCLAKGSYPRTDALPTVLNAYNCRAGGDQEDRLWAYFHPSVTTVPDTATLTAETTWPSIHVPNILLNDIDLDWYKLRKSWRAGNPDKKDEKAQYGRYRFLCFIHKHRIDVPASYQKNVYTISIWDQEWQELTWHDAYPLGRRSRRDDVKFFWRTVKQNFLPKTFYKETPYGGWKIQSDRLLKNFRYKTSYHAFEKLPNLPGPRDSIWFVLSLSILHINEIDDEFLTMPDTVDHVYGRGANMLPKLFVDLMVLCLGRQVPMTGDRAEMFVRLFQVAKRLPWMRNSVKDWIQVLDWPAEEKYKDKAQWIANMLKV